MMREEELAEIATVRGLSLRNTERDYLLDVCLHAVSRYRGALVFKGGTALHKFHGLDRFSEDLDFVLGKRRLDLEGVRDRVYNVGDVMYDALLRNLQLALAQSGMLDMLGLQPKGYFLATIHHPSNTDDAVNLRGILDALNALGEPVVLPVHPRTCQAMEAAGIQPGPSVMVIKPVSYLDMLTLEAKARLILTDSGGVQKEAYLLAVPCVTLRNETEWVETVEAGWNVLSGANMERILSAVQLLNPRGERSNPFGDGRASAKIVNILEEAR